MPEPYQPQIFLPKEDDDVRALSALASMARVPWQDRDKTEEREHAELVRDERRAYNKKLLDEQRTYTANKGDYEQAITDEENQITAIRKMFIDQYGNLHKGLGIDDLDRGIGLIDARNKEYETWYGDEDKQIFTEEGDRIVADEAMRFISLSNNVKNVLLNHKSILTKQLDNDAALVTSLAELAAHNQGFLKTTKGGNTIYDVGKDAGPELGKLMSDLTNAHANQLNSGMAALTEKQLTDMDDSILASKFIKFEDELNPLRTREVNGQIENYHDIVWNPETLEYNVPANWGPKAKQSVNNAYRFFEVGDMVSAYDSISRATDEKAEFHGAQIKALTKAPTPEDIVHEKDKHIINWLNNTASGLGLITNTNPELREVLNPLRVLTMGTEEKDFETVISTSGNVIRKTFKYLFDTTGGLFTDEQGELPEWFREKADILKETKSGNLPFFVKWHLGLISMDYETDGETIKRTKDGQPKFTPNTNSDVVSALREQRLSRYDYVDKYDFPFGKDHKPLQSQGVLAVGQLLEYYNKAYDHNMARPALLLGTGVQNLQQYLNVVGVKPNLNPGNLLDSLNTAALDTTVLDTGVIDTGKSAALVDTNNVPITVTPPDSIQQVLTSLDSLTADSVMQNVPMMRTDSTGTVLDKISTADQDSLLKLASDLRDSSDVSDERDSSLIELSDSLKTEPATYDTFGININEYMTKEEQDSAWTGLPKGKQDFYGTKGAYISSLQAGLTNAVHWGKISIDSLTKVEDKGRSALLAQAQGSKWKDVQPRHSWGTGNAIKKYSKRWDQDNTGRSSYIKKRPEGINTKEEWVLWKMLTQKGFGKIEPKDIREQILFAEKAKKQDPSIELVFDAKTYNKLEEKVLKIISRTKKK